MLQHTSVLSQAQLGYEPIIDRKRQAFALRLSVVPRGERVPMAALYQELAQYWTGSNGSIVIRSDAPIDSALLELKPLETVWLEVPAVDAQSPHQFEFLTALHRHGYTMVLGGRPLVALPASLVAAFGMSIIHVDEDRRLQQGSGQQASGQGFKRSLPYAQEGVRTIETMEHCFSRGAHAVIGWPVDDLAGRKYKHDSGPDYATVVELISMIARDADPADLEKLVRRDPTLAYRLLRYVNSPGVGLSVEVESFRHAVMMLGYARLRRWLALLLATACRDANMRPVMVASYRRGVFLEQLMGEADDPVLRDELFILGVFSLLDKLMQKPFGELLQNLHVPESVRETLLGGSGGFAPYLRVVEAIERGPDPTLAQRLDDCVISLEQCNRATLRALAAPDLIKI